ncbi:Ig-like domain-containing protein [Gallibacterium anatis]|uniref:Ig-like domain-containing protein n=1 Tax=Gallibacterium anatis TaxID=750 RepID=UPI00254CF78F|nr:Ig-like domain-containing protein [Gallibacterium anatis]WIM81652.1 Ig-like domain-containing protein [Gallibacterium anatis]
MARGGGSSAHSAPSDTTPPDQPTDVVISNNGDQITGKAEPGSKVTVKDDQGNVIAEGTADGNGNFAIDLNPPKQNGEKVEVTATDNAGNTSTPTDVIAPDSTPPNKPENLDVSNDGTHVTGKAEPGSTVTVKDEHGNVIGTATAGDNGQFDVTINPPKTNGEDLTVTATDKAGNTSPSNTVKADDNTPPNKPDNLDVSDDGAHVTGTAEPGSTVTVKDENDNPIGTATAGDDGQFDVAINPPKTNGEELKVTATDNANNTSLPGTVTADDSTLPQAPTIAIPEAKDGVNASELSDGVQVDVTLPQGTQVGDTVTLTLQPQTGNAITVDYKVQSGDLSGTDPIVTIPVEKAKFPEQADGKYTVTAQVKDPAGNNSLVSEGKTFTIDTQAPNVTAPEAKEDGSVVITVPDDADKVTVTVQPEGEDTPRDITLTKEEDGSWTSSNSDVVPNVPNGSTTTTIPGDKVTDGSQVTVTAQDKAGNSSDPQSVNAVDINDAPVLTVTLDDAVKNGITENSATEGMTIATSSATDEDGDSLTYSLTDNTGGYYAIDAATGKVTLTEAGAAHVNAGGELPAFTVKADDNKGGITTEDVTAPTVTMVNDAPVLTVTLADAVKDGITEGTATKDMTIATSSATDEDGDSLTYSLTDNTGGYYAIDAATGKVTLTEAGAAHVNAGGELPAFTVKADDNKGGITTEDVTAPTVTMVNDAPVLTVTLADAVKDGITEGTATKDMTIATSSATDEDGDSLTYSLTDNTGGYYAIDAATGKVTLTEAGAAHVNAGGELPAFTVKADDNKGGITTEDVTAPTVTMVNDAPVLTVTLADAVKDGITEGTATKDMTIATSSATDEEGNTLTYSLTDNTDGYYAIDPTNGTVTLTQAGADYVNAGNDLPKFTVQVSDGNDTDSESVTAPATKDVNDAPELTVTLADAVKDGITEGTATKDMTIATSSATDEEGNTLTYSLTDNTDGYYAIDPTNGTVTLTQAGADYVNAGNDLPKFTVQVSDGNDTDSESVTAPATKDVNDAPELTVTLADAVKDGITEGTATKDMTIATSSATDEEGNDLTYSLTDNTDGYYAIDPTNGTVTLTQAGADYVNAGNDLPKFTVQVSDGNDTDSESVTAPATKDVNDAPELTVTLADAVKDGITEGTATKDMTIATSSATDEEGNDLTYSLTDNTDGYYAIDPTNGTVTLTQAGADYVNAGNDLPKFTVQVSDGNDTDSESVTAPATKDVNDAPELTVTLADAVKDGITEGTATKDMTIATSSATDEEGNDLTYSLTDNTDGYYAIDPTNGTVTLTQAGADYVNAGNDLPKFTVQVSDGNDTDSESVTAPATKDVNDAPELTVTLADAVKDGITEGTATKDMTIATSSATDEEGNDLTYSLTDNTDGYYAIDPTNGTVTLTQAGADYVNAGNDLPKFTVQVSDGNDTDSESVTAPATKDVNDAPELTVTLADAVKDGITEGTATKDMTIATSSATDEEGNTLTYSLTDNTDGYYAIDPTNGTVTLTQAGADYVNAGNDLPKFTVQVSDGNDTDSESVTAPATKDVNDAPELTVTLADAVKDGITEGTATKDMTIATSSATDEEGNDLTYSLTDNTDGYYAIDPTNGTVTLTQAGADYVNAGNDLPKFTVQVSDGNDTDSESVTAPATKDVNDAPELTVTLADAVKDGITEGTATKDMTIATSSATDEEGNDLTYSLTDNTDGYYAIDPTNGTVTLTQAGADYVNAGNDLPKFTVQVSDGNDTDSESVTAPATKDVNDAPELTVTLADAVKDGITEGTATKDMTIATSSATDEEGNDLTYSLTDNTDGYYAIDPTNGTVTLTQAGADYVNAGNDLPKFTVQVSDGNDTDSESVTAPATKDVNDAPELTVTLADAVKDGITEGTATKDMTIATSSATDEEGNDLTYSLTDNTDGYYAIDPTNGTVTLTQAGADYVNAGNDLPKFTVQVSDGNDTDSESVTAPATKDVNDAPELTVTLADAVKDGITEGTATKDMTIATSSATDEEGNDLTYSLTDNTDGYYAIDPTNGTVTLTQAGADYVNAGNDLPKFTVQVSDGNDTDSESVTAPATKDVNDAPELTVTLADAVKDGITEGTATKDMTIATSSATDEEGNDLTYSLTDNTDGYYAIDPTNGTVTLTQAGADYVNAGNDLPKFTVQVSDGNDTDSESVTAPATKDVNDAPELTVTLADAVKDGITEGTATKDMTIATSSATDEEGNTLTYSLTDNTDGYYAIDPTNGTVTLTQAGADYVNAGNDLPKFTVQVSDGNDTDSESVTAPATKDVNDAPELTVTLADAVKDGITEGTATKDMTIATSSATDEEGNDLTYSLTDNTDGYYAIDPTNGTVTLTQAGADYVNAGNDLPKFTVQVSDGNDTDSESVTAPATKDVNDAPELTVTLADAVKDGITEGTATKDMTIATSSATDEEGNDLTYSLTDNTDGYYAIDPTNGTVTLTQAGADYVNAGNDLPKFTVQVSDGNDTDSESVTAPATKDVNDAPELTVTLADAVKDGITEGTATKDMTIATSSATDEEGNDLTYSLTDNTDGYYAIDPTNGTVTLTQAGADYVNAGNDLPKFTVQVSDGNDTDSESVTAPATKDVNDAPELTVTLADAVKDGITEGTATKDMTIATSSATDEEGNTLTYSLTDNTDGYYAIDPTNGTVTLTQAGADYVNAGNDLPKFTVQVSDGNDTDSESVTAPATKDVNDAPELTVTLADAVKDGITEGTATKDMTIATSSATDEEGNDLTYSLTDNTDGYYAIDPTNGTVTLTQAGADYVNAGNDLPKFTVQVSDGNDTDSESVTAPATKDVNDAPELTVTLADAVKDGITEGTATKDMTIATSSATDEEGNDLTYSLTDNTDGYYAIDPTNGTVTLTQAGADYVNAGNDLPKFTVQVSDGNDTDSESVTAPATKDVNDAPELTVTLADAVKDGITEGTATKDMTIATSSATDEEGNDLTYSLTDNTDGYYAIDPTNGTVTLTQAGADYVNAGNDLPKFTVQVSDGNDTDSESVTAPATKDVNDAPELTVTLADAVKDGITEGTATKDMTIATSSATDEEGNTLTYSLTDNTDGYYAIDPTNGTVTLTQAGADYVNAGNDLPKFTVQVSDGNDTDSESVTAPATKDVNDAPELTVTLADAVKDGITEGTATKDMTIATSSATDEEGNDLTYSLTDNTDGYYAIDPTNGTVTLTQAGADYVNAGNDLPKFTVQVSDGNDTDSESVTAPATKDVNDAPELTVTLADAVKDGITEGTATKDMTIATSSATDEEGNDLTYSLTDNTDGYYAIDPTNGTVTLTQAGADYVNAGNDLPKFTVQVSDGNDTDSESVTAPATKDVNDAPELTVTLADAVKDGITEGTATKDMTIATSSATDEEGNDLTYSLTDNTDGYYAIDPTNGTVTLTQAGADYVNAGNDLPKFTVQVSDGNDTDSESVTAPATKDVNDAPELTVTLADAVKDGITEGTATKDMTIATSSATDEEGNTLTYSLTDNTDGYYAIDPTNGTVTLTQAGADYVNAGNDLPKFTVQVSDGNDTDSESVTAPATKDVNDAPELTVTLADAVKDGITEGTATKDMTIATSSATDEEGNDLTYSLTDNTDGYYAIDPTNGTVTLTQAGADYVNAGNDLPKFTVQVSDGNDTDSESVTAPATKDVNDAPELTVTLADAVKDGITEGTATKDMTIATSSATDEEGNDLTYSLTDNTDGYYAIDPTNGTVTLTQAGADYVNAGNDLPKFTVQVSDGNDTDSESVTAPATKDVNDAPELTVTLADAVKDGITEGTATKDMTIATSSATDEEGNDLTYSLTDNTDGYYAIDPTNGTVTLTQAGADYVNAGNDLPKFTVQVSDGNDTDSESVTAPATKDVNDAPELTVTLADAVKDGITEGTATKDMTIATSSATDEEGNDLTYSLTDNTDGYYAIDPTNGTVTLTQAGADYVNAGNDLPKFTVQVSDGNDTDSESVTAPATKDVNDAPELTVTLADAVKDGITEGTATKDMTIATSSATDEEGNDLTYSLTDNTDGYYAIDPTNGTVTLTQAGADYVNAGNDLPKFTVQVSDGNDTDSESVTAPATKDVNDAPELTVTLADAVKDGITEGTATKDMTIATSSATDEEGNDLTYSLTDNTDGYYAIDPTNGTVTLTQAGADYVNAGNDLPKFTVQVSDGNDTDSESVTAPATKDVNDAPELTVTLADAVKDGITEGTATKDMTIATSSATDEEGNDLTYSLTDNTDGYYAIDPTNGTVTLTQAGADYVNAGNDLPKFTVQVSDGNDTDSESVTAPATKDVNDAPELTVTLADAVKDGITEGTATKDMTIATSSATDEEGNDLTYSLTDNTDGYYAIDPTNGTVTLTQAGADYVNAGNDLPKFTVQVSDGNDTDSESVTAPATKDVNDAPELTVTLADAVKDGITEGTATKDMTIATSSATDEEGNDLTYSLTDNTDGYYAIDPTNGTVTLTQAGADYVNAGNDLPKFTVQVSDGNDTDSESVTAPATKDVNDAPELTVTLADAVKDGITEGTATKDMTIATSSATDEEGNDLTYSLTDNTDGYYAIDPTNGTVTLTQAGADYVNAGNDLPKFTVQVSDGNDTDSESVTAPATKDVNDAPELTVTLADAVKDGITEGTATKDMTIATSSATDEEGNDLTYSLTDNTDGYYAIDPTNGTVTLTQAGADYVNAGNDLPKFTVQVSDGNDTDSESVTAPATKDVNDAPELTVTLADAVKDGITEGTATKDMTIATSSATDEEGNDLTYSLTDNTDGYYAIDPTNGTVTLTQAGADYVNAGNDLPKFTVQVSDGNDTDSESVTAPATKDVNDAPELTVTLADAVKDGITEGTATKDMTIATSSATDEEGNDLTYSLTDNTDGYYAIDPTNGTVTLTQAGADYVNAGNDLPNFTVQVSDGNSTASKAVDAPATTDVNDAPVLTLTPEAVVTSGFTQGQANAGDLIATATATDEDGDKVTITLEGNNPAYFAIDEATGKITLTEAGAQFVNEGNNLPEITVKADDAKQGVDTGSLKVADTVLDDSIDLEITSNDGETIKGTTDPDSTVEIRNANNEVVGRGTAGSDGKFTIKLTHEEVVSLGKEKANQDIQADHNGDGEPETYHTDEEGNYRYSVDSPIKTGETLTVTSVDPYGNSATQQSKTPDEIAPSAPVIEINEQGTVISGIAEPGSTIVLQVTSKDGQTTQQVATDKYDQPIIANEEGKFTIELKDPLIGKETITATAEDKAGNISTPSDSITAPYFNNELKDVEIGLRNDTGISDRDNITNDGGLKLVGDDSAMITKVEYKDAEGNYQTVRYDEGVYILPEGEYTAGTIRITQQDENGAIKYSTNAEKFVIDTTAPNAVTAVNDKNGDTITGDVTITLPSDAPKGDYVEVMVGNKKVILTSDGNNGWTSSDTALVPTPENNKVTIPHTVAPSGTGVSVQSFDIAGNSATKDVDNVLLDRSQITVTLAKPEVNSDLSNDTETTMVLNTAELTASTSKSNVTVKIYLPDSAQVGDYVEFPFGASILKAPVKQIDIENGYFEVKAGVPMNFALSQGENKYPVKLYQSDKKTLKSEDSLSVIVDKLTPDTPVVESKTGGEVQITLPSGKEDIPDKSTGVGTRADKDDWVIVTAGNESVKLTKTANGWEKPTEVDWITINGNTATIPTNIEKFPYGTTVTAQAFDKAGNQSEQGVGHVVKDPLTFTGFKVTNQDLDTTTPNIVDTNQKAIYYTATVEGQEAEEALIRVRLMKEDQPDPVEVHYLDISSDSQTYKGAFNHLSADYEQYQVIADIVHQDKSTGFNDTNLPERRVDVIVDNVVPQLALSKITSSVSDGPNNKPNSVTIVATDGSHTLKDGNTKVSGAEEMTMKLDFGTAQSDKQRIITDKLGNKVVVYNPKLDWMMRKDDDDDTSSDQYHNDHAQGWGFDTKTAVMYNQDKALFYKWNGDNEAADIIVSGMSRTDEWWRYYNRRGWIGAENSGSAISLDNTNMTQFVMDTQGGGNDYISAPAIAGNVVIRTNDGDDMITTMNLQGRYDYYAPAGYSRPNVDGSNQIYMGDGNDTFEVTGTAKDTEKEGYASAEMNYASLYATNAKIDMGSGDDKVSIKWNVFTGSQKESGNYFNLGEGDDTMIVGGNVLGQLRETSYEGSTIINLGSGNDTLSLAKIERESNYLPPLVLITSKESANVTIRNVKEAQLSMMMGDGEDKVTISKDLILSGQKSDWISQVFANNDRFVQQGIERYKNFYDQALKDQINSSLERAIDLIATDSQDRSATGSRAVVGADRVATSTSERITEIIDVLDLGDGQNTLSVTGKMFGVNYFGGKDVDTIQSGVTENSRFWLGLGEDSVKLAQMANSAIYAGAGEDKITVGGIARQDGRGSIISAEDGNDTIIINKLPNKLVALEADNSRIFGGKGDDTITINGDLFGTGNQIFGDADNDTITISGNIRGYNNLIDGGAGNDIITLDGEVVKDQGGKLTIQGGDGNDTISVGNIGTEDNVSIFAGSGSDTVTIKNVKGDNDHIIDLGEDVNKTDYDILSIEGSQSEGYNNQFSIGGTPSDHAQIWGAEEIRFTGTGVTVKIVSGNLVNNNTGLPPAGKDELFIHNGTDAGNNKVQLSREWVKSGGLISKEFNGKTYDNVQEYHYSSSNGTSEDILYIQQGVTVEII